MLGFVKRSRKAVKPLKTDTTVVSLLAPLISLNSYGLITEIDFRRDIKKQELQILR